MAGEQPPQPEPKNPERLGHYQELIGLQSRLLIGGEALNHQNRALSPITAEQLTNKTQREQTTYDYLANASVNERKDYWKVQNIEGYAAQKAKWIETVSARFQGSKDTFEQMKWHDVFTKLGINSKEFTPQEAEKLLTNYVGSKNSAVKKFVDDVLKSYTTNDQVDYDQLKKDIPVIQWLANIFGDKAAQITAQLTDAEGKITNKDQQEAFVSAANLDSRLNKLEDKEVELLDYMQKGKELPSTSKPESAGMHPDWEKLRTKALRFGDGTKEAWDNATKIREIFTQSAVAKKGLPVYYPGAAGDIDYALAFTDATEFVFDDFRYVKKDGSLDTDTTPDDEIKQIGGSITGITAEGTLGKGGKRTITFEWAGKTRKITMYSEDASKFLPSELNNSSSMLIIKAPTPASRTQQSPEGYETAETPDSIFSPEPHSRLLSSIAIGGYYNLKPTQILPTDTVGFQPIIDLDRVTEHGYPLYQKIHDEPEMLHLFKVDHELEWSIGTRNGDAQATFNEQTPTYFKEQLQKLRSSYVNLSREKRNIVNPILQRHLLSTAVPPQDRQKLKNRGRLTDQQVEQYWKETISVAESLFPELVAAPDAVEGKVTDKEAEEVMTKFEIHNYQYDQDPLKIVQTREQFKKDNLQPKHKLKIGDATYWVSTPMKSSSGRSVVVAYVEKNGKLIARPFYRSNSHALFKYVGQMDDSSWLCKEYGEESIVAPVELQKLLAEITTDGQPQLPIRGSYVRDRIVDSMSEEEYNLIQEILNTTDDTKKREAAKKLKDLSKDYEPDYRKEIDVIPMRIGGDLYSLKHEEKKPPEKLVITDPNQAPNFSTKLMSWAGKNPYYGEINYDVFASADGKLKYIFCKDKKGRAWIAGIENDSEVGSTGLKKSWVTAGDLETPAYEYKDYAATYGNDKDVNGDYIDMFANYLSKIPVIQEYLKAAP